MGCLHLRDLVHHLGDSPLLLLPRNQGLNCCPKMLGQIHQEQRTNHLPTDYLLCLCDPYFWFMGLLDGLLVHVWENGSRS